MNSYTKLLNGEWGIRVTGKDTENLRSGKIIQVGTKEGAKSEKTIKSIIKTYNDAVICSFFEDHEQMAKFNAQDEYMKFLQNRKTNHE